MFTYICNSGNASFYPDFSGEQFEQFIHLLQEDTGIGPGTHGPTSGCHKPMADIWENTTSYDAGNQEDHPKLTGDFRCRTAHNTHQKVLPGTSPLDKRQLRQVALSMIHAQATAMAASVPVLAEGAGHPEVESTKAIIATNLLPVR